MSTEIRLAEDQMQRLMRCVLASNMRCDWADAWGYATKFLGCEPKPEPPQEESQTATESFLPHEVSQLKRLAMMHTPVGGVTQGSTERLIKMHELMTDNRKLKQLCDSLRAEIEELKVQVPRRRLRVRLFYFSSIDKWGIESVETMPPDSKEAMMQFATDRGMEVVE